MTLNELLTQVPADTLQRVEQTKEFLNEPIRIALGQVTGLALNRVGTKTKGVSVPIEIVLERPKSLESVEFDEITPRQQLAIQLALRRPWLEQLCESAETLAPALEEIPSSLQRELQRLTRDREKSLPQVSDLAKELLTIASSFDLVQWLHNANDDVLGRYFYGEDGGMIKLYCGVIGITAMTLGVRVEDLTAVVLAHELAHAYTHLGMDIEGCPWPFTPFPRSDRK